MKLRDYQSHYDLKDLKTKALIELANDVRQLIIATVTKNGGHLASNLGTVELTISLLKIFDIDNNDIIIFDTGHQTYAYKILTDRKTHFSTIRLPDGLAAFQHVNESKYDYISNGHAGTGLSTAIAYSYNPKYNNIICVIGDASFTNGLTLEALTHLGLISNKIIVVLNDNGMSISKNVNILHTTVSKVRTGWLYRSASKVSKVLRYIPPLTLLWLAHLLVEKIIRSFAIPGLFAGFNLDYIGTVDGHNFRKLNKSFRQAKKSSSSVIVHVKTKKGYGYGLTQTEQEKYHSYSLKDTKTSEWSYYVAQTVEKVFHTVHEKFYFISAAMQASIYLEEFMLKNEKYCIDVGLAEEHAITLASGFALDHQPVVVSMYASFLQRTYDQILHDVVRNRLPVIFLIDRAALSPGDGDSHHGIYDVGFLNSMGDIPIISQPATSGEFDHLFKLALVNKQDPFFIRYPKGGIIIQPLKKEFNLGQWEHVINNKEASILLITYGNNVTKAQSIITKLATNKIDVINARFINPVDKPMLKQISTNNYQQIIIFEEVINQTGLYAKIIDFLPSKKTNITHYGYQNGLGKNEDNKLEEILQNLIN
ncbi:1-deoxy-D-xylulose-5-phosphate synthase [Spiroplasma sp. NBRC 100390]|uniref:1-deoxy-D-xylulose-5-phosphate synthase n=1 Tax=unclassified Spiroplasma TaxID=2637901 RepID=UPI000892A18D|nr:MULTISPECIES: 1-deoxy-D-xylulose-5-phosphate synthase [unclassified Spiroplasma]AOX43912.1 1-deoxy-D-xylulose-5-phosphate synthase [Spiroplasma sp. TU-14]APE13382.1 1-deoxy-D-xylulose-5-phosphate synthase [Spiroplasma sp. NBRC 100390]